MSFYPSTNLRVWSAVLAADQSTTSTVFVDLPGLSITFTPRSSMVRLTFVSSCTKNPTGGTGFAQLVLDGTALTPSVASNQGSTLNEATPMSCESLQTVTPGVSHTVKVQWHIDSAGSLQCFPVSDPFGENASLWVEEVSA